MRHQHRHGFRSTDGQTDVLGGSRDGFGSRASVYKRRAPQPRGDRDCGAKQCAVRYDLWRVIPGHVLSACFRYLYGSIGVDSGLETANGLDRG